MKANRRLGSWPRHWDKWPETETDIGCREYVGKAPGRHGIMLAAIRRVSTQGTHRSTGRLIRRYLASAVAQTHAMSVAYRRRVHSLGIDARPEDFVEVIRLARKMNLWNGALGRATAFPVLKADAEYRWTHRSSVTGFAAELLLRDVAKASSDLLPTQFGIAGGRPKFEEWLAMRMQSAALVITTDIPSCYETISRESLVTGLPIPRKVLEKVIFRQKESAIYLKQAPGGYVPMKETEIAEVSSRSGGGSPRVRLPHPRSWSVS